MTTTHCPYCSLQCGMKLERKGRALEVQSWPEFPVNEGALCGKGWTATGLRGHRERLTTPLVRDRATGELRAAGWDEALDLVAGRLRTLREAHGPDTVAVFGGGGLTNEKAYQLGKLARVALGTSQIDYNGRWCMSSAASAANQAFGIDRGLPFPLADVEHTDVLVLVGSNLAETMPPAARHLDRLRDNGGHVVVIDPRLTSTAGRADTFLQPVPGTDLAVALGLLHLLDAAGAVDEDYIAARTTGFDDVRRAAAGWWPERVERTTGVEASVLRDLAARLGAAERVIVLTARGAEQHRQGTDTVLAWIDVALALGMPGKEHAGYGCLTGQGNGQGGREHGQKADQLPGYRMIDDPAAREHVAGVWGVPAASLPGAGRSAYELLDALGTDGGSRALLVFGSNIVVSAPNATQVTSRLADLDLLVVADIVLSETAALADVVLPVTQWAEETGTMTNLEGRVILRERAVAPPEGVRSDLDVMAGLATRLDSPIAFSTDPEEIFAELGAASSGGRADYAGISYDRIRDEHGVFWPCPTPDHPGTPRMFADSFATPDGRARFVAVEHRGPAEQPDAAYPLHLTTGRVLGQYQSGAQTRRVRDLPDAGPFIEIHPMLADRIGAYDGDPVIVTTRRGELKAPARVTDHDPAGHGLRAVPLGRRQPAHQRRPRPDQPDARVQGLCLRGARMSERIVVVGNGMAATRLVEELVATGSDHDITVLGEEPHPSYNRILLSAVLEGTHRADGITLRAPEWYAERGVDLRLGKRVLQIDPERRDAMLVDGTCLDYDRLVLATGSIPSLPPIRGLVRMDGRLDGRVHAFRSLDDCERLLGAIDSGTRAVVVGGGLLGLQVARALSIRGLATEVVEGGEHLLRSQVDPQAGAILARDLSRLGTTTYTGARAVRLTEGGLVLDNGYLLETDLVVLTAGGRPSTALARAAGLEVRRGIVVDDQLRTSDDRIHAIGDCAQHAGRVTGFVPPAWEQATLLARHLTGEDVAYTGSRSVARLRATDLDVAVLGDPEDADGEVVQVSNPITRSHRKLVVRDGVIVAATLVGDLSRIGLITQHYDRGTVLGPAEPGDLLMGVSAAADNRPAALPDDAEVCACAGVSAGRIRACGSLEEVRESTRATTGCGGCAPAVRSLLATRPTLEGTPR